MVHAPQRTTIRGPTFIRLLASLTDVDVAQSKQSLTDRLSQWLDWTHAIALSTALDGKPSAAADVPAFGSAEEDECARVRTSLANAITADHAWAAATQRGVEQWPAEEDVANAVVDYTAFRQHYLAVQRSMQTATGHLRGRLRDMLAQASTEMARLAEVDAVMELALTAREHTLLAAVPGLLGEHFERLQQAGRKALAGTQAPEGNPVAPGSWLDVFRKDMQSVLLAELDVRFQPVEGLLAALRAR